MARTRGLPKIWARPTGVDPWPARPLGLPDLGEAERPLFGPPGRPRSPPNRATAEVHRRPWLCRSASPKIARSARSAAMARLLGLAGVSRYVSN
ncbi:hypothetical protein NL676_024910 [Syzygium grande]|nr:hypothetical protein NL676_024910 [Syzygium grande]